MDTETYKVAKELLQKYDPNGSLVEEVSSMIMFIYWLLGLNKDTNTVVFNQSCIAYYRLLREEIV